MLFEITIKCKKERAYEKNKASELDKKFDEGKEDILEYFDMKSIRRVGLEQKRVNVDFPAWMVNSIDKEATRLGVTRQSLIKMWLASKLESVRPSAP